MLNRVLSWTWSSMIAGAMELVEAGWVAELVEATSGFDRLSHLV